MKINLGQNWVFGKVAGLFCKINRLIWKFKDQFGKKREKYRA